MKPLKWYENLASVKGRREQGCFLVEGFRAVKQVVTARPEAVTEILCLEPHADDYSGYPQRIVTPAQLRRITGQTTPQGIAAAVTLPEHVYTDSLPAGEGDLLLLDGVQDPGNAGTLIRTAAAFDFAAVIFGDTSADPFSPKCVQASAGTVLSLTIRKCSLDAPFLRRLQKGGWILSGLDLGGDTVMSGLKPARKRALCLGSEARGISSEVAGLLDERILIPIDRQKAESLNVAVSGAICMYHMRQQVIDIEKNF